MEYKIEESTFRADGVIIVYGTLYSYRQIRFLQGVQKNTLQLQPRASMEKWEK
jgi:hypothetical protein